MNKLCFHHVSIAVEELKRARQFYADVLEMQELDRPDIFGHPEIWYKIGDGPPQLHILVARALPHVIHVNASVSSMECSSVVSLK